MNTGLTNTIMVLFMSISTLTFGQDSVLTGIPPLENFGMVEKPISAPDNIQASDGTSHIRIKVKWDAVADADGYYVYRDTHKSGKNMQVLPKKYKSPGMYDSKGLEAGRLYYYWIAAVDKYNETNLAMQRYDSGYLIAAAFNIMPTPFTPEGIQSPQQPVEFAWAMVAGATAYRFQLVETAIDNWASQNGYSEQPMVKDTVLTDNQLVLNLSNYSTKNFAWTVQAIRQIGDTIEQSEFSPYTTFSLGATDEDGLTNLRSAIRLDTVTILNDSIQRGQPLFTEITLTNTGTAIGKNIQLSYFLSKDEQLDSQDIKLQQYLVEEIAAGENYETILVTTIVENLKIEGYYLLATVLEEQLSGNMLVVPLR